jgi:hypothetical protein
LGSEPTEGKTDMMLTWKKMASPAQRTGLVRGIMGSQATPSNVNLPAAWSRTVPACAVAALHATFCRVQFQTGACRVLTGSEQQANKFFF